ncbi:unnamed protein product [Diatraea saccharalis]|uniref:Uncharacterized protein n=1 Tax=Diatraea saccharalis TaxID=40085 RepID=A0A9P0G1C9_9NEOP|nr:unnamed protein product [Diatraea saccharalis]
MDVFLTGVSKKLLVAMSVAVIVTMCLKTTAASPLEHRRHNRHMTRTLKDSVTSKTEARIHEAERTTKEQKIRRLLHNDQYGTALQKVKHKMANTKDNFDERRRILTEPKDYGSGMPPWLPKTNFVDIHERSNKIANRKDASRSKQYFSYNIRQLYKSLVVYQELFKIFKQVGVISPDIQITNYNTKREDFFKKTIDDLYSTIEDIKDAMVRVKMPIPKVDSPKRLKLDTIEMKVNSAKYLKNDDILFRGYGNLLDNWHLELNCSKVTKPVKKGMLDKCMQYRKSLKEKRNKRKRNKRRKLL